MEALREDERGQTLAAISNAVLGLHRDNYGRGAVRARTIIQGDYVACFLEDIYTPVEHTLIRAGQWEQVRNTRTAFQDALSAEFRAAVEEITGRTVVAFFSQVHHDPDMAIEAFVLAQPQDG
jgi:uncharacterized protein YbcI